jgi:hypothetical protein
MRYSSGRPANAGAFRNEGRAEAARLLEAVRNLGTMVFTFK